MAGITDESIVRFLPILFDKIADIIHPNAAPTVRNEAIEDSSLGLIEGMGESASLYCSIAGDTQPKKRPVDKSPKFAKIIFFIFNSSQRLEIIKQQS